MQERPKTQAEFYKQKAETLKREADYALSNAADADRMSALLAKVILENSIDDRLLEMLRIAIEEKQRNKLLDCDSE